MLPSRLAASSSPALVVCALTLVASMQRPPLEARFIGNMAFAISDGTVTLMSDFPYQSGYSRYMAYQASEIRSSTLTTLSLITHRHADHWEPALFAQTGWQVAGPADVVSRAPASRVIALSEPHTTVGPLQIERLTTRHADVGHYSYIVTWHGRRLYFTGDTEDVSPLVAAKDLDVAFVSPWNYRAVVRAGQHIDARQVVIYHHESGEQIAECRDRCSIPQQGQTLAIP